MLVALTVTPALSLVLLSKRQLAFRESPLIPALRDGYERILARVMKNPALVNSAIVVLIVAGLIVVPFLRWDQLLPAFREPYLTVKVEGAPPPPIRNEPDCIPHEQ
jgi:Cu/Ag efflux pump CusA